jgi:hypothetical protein
MTRLRQKEEVYVYLQMEGQVALFRQLKKQYAILNGYINKSPAKSSMPS